MRQRPHHKPNHFLVSINTLEHRGVKYSPEEIFETLMDAGYWELGPDGANRTRLSPGDLLVFYMSGKGRYQLVGTATVASPPAAKCDADPILFGDRDLPFMKYRFAIKDQVKWGKPRPIHPLLTKLSFIEARLVPYWGLYFRQATRLLTKDDYVTLTRGKANP